MQPDTPTPQKQVMDITAPPRQVPSAEHGESLKNQPLPVHAAPAATDEDQNSNDAPADNSISQQEPEADVPSVNEKQSPVHPKKAQPIPAVAITFAVFAMLGLSAVAIMIYLNS